MLRSFVQMGVIVAAINAGQAGAAMATGSNTIKLVAFGDSLTAGYGVRPGEAFPVQLEAALRAKGLNVEVVNSGVSGDTASGGLDRFDWAVPEDADAVILELGANDALRGVPPEQTSATLDKLMSKLAERKLPVLLAGMRAPKNWGDDYAGKFDAIFPILAAKHTALLYPFFLDGVVMDRTMNQGDGIHPTGKGVAMIVSRILPKVEELIAKVSNAGSATAAKK
ncbi:MAG: arylesterase [Hyphomicrobiaceae bacterium]